MAVRDDLREAAYALETEPVYDVEVGEHYIDGQEPTPSPEVNTVEVVGLVGERANEYETDEGKLICDYSKNRFYPDDDPVVACKYPNMSSDKVWHMPQSRLE